MHNGKQSTEQSTWWLLLWNVCLRQWGSSLTVCARLTVHLSPHISYRPTHKQSLVSMGGWVVKRAQTQERNAIAKFQNPITTPSWRRVIWSCQREHESENSPLIVDTTFRIQRPRGRDLANWCLASHRLKCFQSNLQAAPPVYQKSNTKLQNHLES